MTKIVILVKIYKEFFLGLPYALKSNFKLFLLVATRLSSRRLQMMVVAQVLTGWFYLTGRVHRWGSEPIEIYFLVLMFEKSYLDGHLDQRERG